MIHLSKSEEFSDVSGTSDPIDFDRKENFLYVKLSFPSEVLIVKIFLGDIDNV